MNSLTGNIVQLDVSGNLTLAHVKIMPHLILQAIVIATPKTAAYLNTGQSVNVLFKETEVIVSTDSQSNISLQNRIPASIATIEGGQLLSRLNLISEAGKVNAIICTSAVKEMQLKAGTPVVAMVKLNEIILQAL